MWRQAPCRHLLFQIVFHPRPRVGGRRGTGHTERNGRDFNPRPRVGGDANDRVRLFPYSISIHAPAWGATCWLTPPAAHTGYFNPRPRVGGDADFLVGCNNWVISIHAPAWGATLPLFPPPLERKISIHAPAWGATRNRICGRHNEKFQSTPPRGGRLEGDIVRCGTGNFNPRPRVGGDGNGADGFYRGGFQSTPPRGGRRLKHSKMYAATKFQSTPPRGGRLKVLMYSLCL